MQLWINNWAASLLQPLSAAATTAEVDPNAAARLTRLGSGDHYLLTLIGTDELGNENAWEIVRVTAAVSGSLTIERGLEGTSAAEWPAGARLEVRITAGALNAIPRAAEDVGAYPSDAGAVLSGLIADLQARVGVIEGSQSAPGVELISVPAISSRRTVWGRLLALGVPWSVQGGDLLVAAVSTWGDGMVLTAPPGWDLLAEADSPPDNTVTCRIYTRVASALDAGTQLILEAAPSVVGDIDIAGQVVVLRSVQTPIVLDTATAPGSGGNRMPAAPVTGSAALQVAFCAVASDYFDRLLVAPTGWVQLSPVVEQDAAGYVNSNLVIGYRLVNAAETATGDFINAGDLNITDNRWIAISVLIGRPGE